MPPRTAIVETCLKGRGEGNQKPRLFEQTKSLPLSSYVTHNGGRTQVPPPGSLKSNQSHLPPLWQSKKSGGSGGGVALARGEEMITRAKLRELFSSSLLSLLISAFKYVTLVVLILKPSTLVPYNLPWLTSLNLSHLSSSKALYIL
jgi:hypothetical protein